MYRVKEVNDEVNSYFLENWPFPNSKSQKGFLGSDFTSCMCYNYPEALDDRIGVACRLIALLFLVDDLLDHMSLEDGRLYNKKVMALMKGDILPDRSVAVEWMSYDIWAEMRALDSRLAGEVVEPMADFMAAQTEKERLKKMGMEEYLEWRGRDVGASLVTALGRFAMGLVMSAEDLALVEPLDRIWFRHVSVMNDVWSYDKEVRQSQKSQEEGAVLRSSVAILCEETQVAVQDPSSSLSHLLQPLLSHLLLLLHYLLGGPGKNKKLERRRSLLSVEDAKRILTQRCRDWEDEHKAVEKTVVAKRDSSAIRQYIRGLEHQMSGNEIWSTTTLRYAAPARQHAPSDCMAYLLPCLLSLFVLVLSSTRY
ncbi:Aristolochene synthase [Apiospora kogelbergensis]|uniref:Aristolochene synthase n=1 Tax=Apiospora kogelbergensis TaxID=1337665 RepID=UPI003130DACA